MEEKRQRLLLACGGFRAHDEHLKSFFNDPIPKAMGEMPSGVCGSAAFVPNRLRIREMQQPSVFGVVTSRLGLQ